MVEIRRIRADEGLVNRDVRLRGLAESPEAFQTTLAGAEVRPESYWHDVAVQPMAVALGRFLLGSRTSPARRDPSAGV